MVATASLTRLCERLDEVSRRPPAGADAARTRAGRRAQGAYFTPLPLVEFVVAETLRARLAAAPVTWRDDGSPRLRVLDPSAGDGRFLTAAVAYLAERAHERGHDRDHATVAIAGNCVIGIERDPEFAAIARRRLGDRARIHCREALLDAPDVARDSDVIVGNPPYLRSIRLAHSDPALWSALKGRYAATSRGEWDLYAAFIEQTLAWLSPAGHAGLVVPSRWLTAAFASGLRAELARAGAVHAIVDFGAAQLFSGATTYASVVFLSRTRGTHVAVARRHGRGWQSGRIPASSLSGRPWRLSVGGDRAVIEQLCARGPALGDVARIVKGAGTNADGVYVIEDARRRRGLIRGVTKAAGEVEVEAAACRPCIRGRDVRAYGAVDDAVWCIVPYDRCGALWSPDQLAAHPRAAAHLARLRRRLDQRESGRHAGARFYRFGRPQNMKFMAAAQPKLVVPDVARGGRALLDHTAAMVLDSAYAIRLNKSDTGYSLPLLLAVLNSPIVGFWLTQTGVPLRGGYVRLKTAYLRSLPLPPVSPITARLADAAGRASCPTGEQRARLDDLVRQAYGLDRAVWGDIATAGAAPRGEKLSSTGLGMRCPHA